MKIAENTPITAERPGQGESFRLLGFRAVSARLHNEFGDSERSTDKRIGQKPDHITTRSIALSIESDNDAMPRGGVYVGGRFPEGGFGAAEGSKRLSDMAGFCSIWPRPDDPDRNYSVGELCYREEWKTRPDAPDSRSYPDTYFIEVYLPEPLFNDLVANLRMGRLPKIGISVRGLKLLNFEEYHWGTDSDKHLPIVRFNTEFVSMVDNQRRKEHRPYKLAEEELYFPPNKADLSLLLQELNTQSEWIKALAERSTWLVYGLAAIVGILVFRLF